jgi:3-oxoacyl-[acyl-carrier protein] reductase
VTPDAKRLIDLTGKRALVTGASRGIGKATAVTLARAGADVCIGYRAREGDAAAVVEECRAHGVRAWAQAGDLTRADEADSLVARCEDELGGLDVFVGNHGIWTREDVAVESMTDEQWHATVSANLDSMFYVCRAAARRLRRGGRIVLVSSTAAQRGEAFHVDYAATKGALVSMVKGLCVELAPRRITVNAVAPGWVATEMSASALAGSELQRAAAAIPLGRIAAPEDVAGPIVFLCSDLAAHVTGEIVNVNGGSVLVG